MVVLVVDEFCRHAALVSMPSGKRNDIKQKHVFYITLQKAALYRGHRLPRPRRG